MFSTHGDYLLDQILNVLKGDVPPVLWHYTTASAFESILRFSNLRATHVRYLNDRNELEHARKLLSKRILDDARRTADDLTREQELAAHWRVQENADKSVALIDKHFGEGHVWALSFSAVADDLSQWRAYGGSGDRYCIGFRSGELQRLRVVSDTKSSLERGLFRVGYAGGEKRKLVAALARFATERLHGPERRHAPRDVVSIIRSVAALLKDDAFSAEQEWRLIIASDEHPSGVDVTERHGRLRPFLTVAPDHSGSDKLPLPIATVTVLPESDRDLAVVATKLLLRSRGYADVNVKLSKVPFTGL